MAPYECALIAIENRAAAFKQHRSLPSEYGIGQLAAHIAQYGFRADMCDAFARRISESGSLQHRTLSEWLALFIEETQLEPIRIPGDMQFNQRVRIDGCINADAVRFRFRLRPRKMGPESGSTRRAISFTTSSSNTSEAIAIIRKTHAQFFFFTVLVTVQPTGLPSKESTRSMEIGADFSDCNQSPRVQNRGGFYLSRYLPAAIRWASARKAPSVLVFKEAPHTFTTPPVRSYDFFTSSTEPFWQTTIGYYRNGCVWRSPSLTGAGAAAVFSTDANLFHCLIGPWSTYAIEDMRRWDGWRARAHYTGRGLDDVFVRQLGYPDNNEQYCIKAPFRPTPNNFEGELVLVNRLNSCFVLVAYL